VTEHAPAGWYDDPQSPGRMRYFDGELWTNHFHKPGELPDVGNWLNNTFTGLLSNWPGAVGIALATSLVGNLVLWISARGLVDTLAWTDGELVGFDTGTGLGVFAVVVFMLLWQALGWMALNRFLQRAHCQAQPTVAEAAARALKRLPKYVGVILGLAVVAMVIFFVLVVISLVSPVLALIVILAGVLVAVWVFIKLTFLSAAIVAAPAGTSAIRTSAHVSAGRFWAVFGRVVLLTIVVGVGSSIIGAIIGAVTGVGSVVDADVLGDIVVTTGDQVEIRDFALKEFFDSGALGVEIAFGSLLQAATALITTSAFMRLYLDSGAPSEL